MIIADIVAEYPCHHRTGKHWISKGREVLQLDKSSESGLALESSKLGPLRRYLVTHTSQKHEPFYPLSDEPGLFVRFANLGTSDKEICSFAESFGTLDAPHFVYVSDFEGDEAVVIGESIDDWLREIRNTKFVLDHWNIPGRFCSNRIQDCIHWENDAVIFDDGSQVFDLTHYLHGVDEYDRCFERKDVQVPAKRLIADHVNSGLIDRVNYTLDLDQTTGDFVTHVTPANLIGAIWFQISMAVGGNKSFRACEHCNTVFEVAPDIARTNRRYCDDKCKAKAYRARRKGANDGT